MRKKRKKHADSTETATKPAAVPAISTSLKGAIGDWKQHEAEAQKQRAAAAKAKPKPVPPKTMAPPGPSIAPKVPDPASFAEAMKATKLSVEDQNALERAFSGVAPLTGRKRGGPSARVGEARAAVDRDTQQARARLDALVGTTARIVVEQAEEQVIGLRDGVARTALRRLHSANARPEATLDLHGERAEDAAALVTKFVRMQHRKGLRLLLIVHGKGLHSEHGIGVLGDRVVHTLSQGGAAPLVAAFATPHAAHGSSGALMVELISG